VFLRRIPVRTRYNRLLCSETTHRNWLFSGTLKQTFYPRVSISAQKRFTEIKYKFYHRENTRKASDITTNTARTREIVHLARKINNRPSLQKGVLEHPARNHNKHSRDTIPSFTVGTSAFIVTSIHQSAIPLMRIARTDHNSSCAPNSYAHWAARVRLGSRTRHNEIDATQ
jgi:hypothetical protein